MKKNIMNDWSLPWEGYCRCGQVRFKVSVPPLLTMACHCTGCQRMTASAFSLSIAVPSDGFSILKGEPTIGGLHGATQHCFCPYCKSWMFTRPEGIKEFVNVRLTMLENASWFTPFIETWTKEKLPWVTTLAVRSFETVPKYEDYAELVKEYAQQASKSE